MQNVFSVSVDEKGQYDVVVVGGGTAGCVAAIAAAREGTSVCLIEQFGALGGSATMGLVTPMMHAYIEGHPDHSGISDEINRRGAAAGYFIWDNGREGFFDPAYQKYLLEKMVREADVKICLYTVLLGVEKEGNCVRSVVVHDKAGIHRVRGSAFIDATGDGDLAAAAGAMYTSGNPRTGKNQCISLRYMVSGIDMDAFEQTAPELIRHKGWYYYGFCTRLDGERSVEKILRAGLDAGELIPEDLMYWQFFSVPGRPGTLAFNCPEFFEDRDGTNPEHLNRAQLMGKEGIFRQLAFYKKHFRGFEKAYVSEIAPMVGVRESREIACEYILTREDASQYRKFEDAIAQTNYPIDIHGEYSNKFAGDLNQADPYFEIPYRSLVVKQTENLLVAGRCIGCDFYVQASVRIQPTCRATGEAAGIAAAWSVHNGKRLRELTGQQIRHRMIECGGQFHGNR